MTEILVKTLTRHRDPLSKSYMKDWTAFDVCQIMPDGYFTKNKHGGAKGMGIVLKVDGKIPADYHGGVILNPDITYANKSFTSAILGRSQKTIDLTKILTDQQLRDCFNHDLLMQPIYVKGSYIDLFQDRSTRTGLHPYDQSGSFDNETVDVGPAGHADANTFFEFESNVTISAGAVIGLADEAFTETATITINGTGAVSGKAITFRTTGAGFHGGKHDATKQLINVTDGIGISIIDEFVDFDKIQVEVNNVTGDDRNVLNYSNLLTSTFNVSNCILKSYGGSTYASAGIFIFDPDIATFKAWNTVIFNGSSVADSGNAGVRVRDAVNAFFYNLTIQGFYYGLLQNAGTVDAYNTIAYANVNNAFQGTFGTTNFNASDDATGGTNSIDNVDFTSTPYFTNAAAGDFSLTADAADVINAAAGDDQSGGLFADDIIGTSRPQGANWDVGAFEFVAAAGGLSIPVSLDALIKKTISQTLSIDALLQQSIPITLSLDAILSITGTEIVSIDALLQKIGVQSSLSIDALIQKEGTEITSLDALIKKAGVIFQVSMDALLTKTNTVSTAMDAVLLKSLVESLSMDAILFSTETASALMDANVTKLQTMSTSLDAFLEAFGIEVGLDALISKTTTQIASLDALLLKGEVSVTSLDSILSQQLSFLVNMDAIMQKGGTTATFLDAVIFGALVTAIPKYYFEAGERANFRVTESRVNFESGKRASFRYV